MTIPRSGQTVHMMTWRDVWRVRRLMRRTGGRNFADLKFYTTTDLLALYKTKDGDVIRLEDGIISRIELVAEIRWRQFWAAFSYRILLIVTIIGALAAIIAAWEGRKAF